jgi:hypothetical protein
MSTNPLKVGHIIRVDGDTVEVQLSIRDLRIEYDGRQHRVGRLGTYVTIPMDGCKIIGYVTCVGVHGDLEPGPDPDKPRRVSMTTQLLGTVRNGKFSRGVNEYPTLGEEVLLGVEEDFRMIFGTFDDMAGGGAERKSFSFGRFAVDTAFEVRALGKEFFAKHVAVMGNSGSGKSVTTTKILHEALQLPHTQIIMFDMHGEYRSAFSDDDGEPLPNVTYLSDRNLVLPYWMLRYEEFERIFVDTSDPQNLNAQKVFLRQAFEKLKRPAAVELGLLAEYTIDTPVYYSLDQLKTYAENMNEARFVLSTDNYAFARLPFRQLRPEKQEELLLAQRMEFNRGNSEGEVPHATYFGRLLGLVNQIESRMNDRRYDFLLRPFQQAARNPDIAPFLNEEAGPGVLSRSVSAVISQMLGRLNDRKNLTIVDSVGPAVRRDRHHGGVADADAVRFQLLGAAGSAPAFRAGLRGGAQLPAAGGPGGTDVLARRRREGGEGRAQVRRVGHGRHAAAQRDFRDDPQPVQLDGADAHEQPRRPELRRARGQRPVPQPDQPAAEHEAGRRVRDRRFGAHADAHADRHAAAAAALGRRGLLRYVGLDGTRHRQRRRDRRALVAAGSQQHQRAGTLAARPAARRAGGRVRGRTGCARRVAARCGTRAGRRDRRGRAGDGRVRGWCSLGRAGRRRGGVDPRGEGRAEILGAGTAGGAGCAAAGAGQGRRPVVSAAGRR